MNEELEADLHSYTNQLKMVNSELTLLDQKREQVLKIAARLEGVVSYLKSKVPQVKLNPTHHSDWGNIVPK